MGNRRKSKYRRIRSGPLKPTQYAKPLEKWNRRLNIFIYSTIPLVLFCAIYAYRHQSAMSEFARMLSPFGAWAYLTSLALLIAIKLRLDKIIGNLYAVRCELDESSRKNERRSLTEDEKYLFTDDKFARNLIFIRIAIEISYIEMIAVPVIYISGITNNAAAYLSQWFTFLGPRLANIGLSILSVLATGIIGNAGYDLLKKLVRRTSEGKQNRKSSSIRR